MGQDQPQVDQLDRIAADADSAARAFAGQEPTIALVQHVICSDVLPLLKAMAAEMGDRDADLDNRVAAVEEALEEAVSSIVDVKRAQFVDILQRAVTLGEEVHALVLPPDAALKERARLLSALATEGLLEIEQQPEEESEEASPEVPAAVPKVVPLASSEPKEEVPSGEKEA